jgi:hypothetical protein
MMTVYYSEETGGFYNDKIHNIESMDNLFLVDDETYNEFLNGKYSDKNPGVVNGEFAFIDRPPAPEEPAQNKINRIEKENLMPRALRDLVLSDKTHGAYDSVLSIETEIAAIRQEL